MHARTYFALIIFVIHLTARAQTTITFDELSVRPLNGVSINGVTFAFTGFSPDIPTALFGTTFASYGETQILAAPWAAGASAGELRMHFDQPVSAVSFDVGLTTTLTLGNGFFVSAYNGETLLGSFTVSTRPNKPGPFAFSEGTFSYSGVSQPVTDLTVTFNQTSNQNFVMDDLYFVQVPEPKTGLLFLGFLLQLFVLKVRRSGGGSSGLHVDT